MAQTGTRPAPDRCPWGSTDDPAMRAYHDREWGVPVHRDRTHFEFLVLEGAQAGLSWSTVLHRRAGYRSAFDRFDPRVVARYSPARVDRLCSDARIIRNRRKIESAVQNARAFLRVQREFGTFDAYVWRFVGGRPRTNHQTRRGAWPATSPESDALSKDLRSRGFAFVGSTIVYAHMQAVGMVNDHTVDCFRYRQVARSGNSRR
jgi:DNA-3-methyladenine glycosylase I